MKGTILVVGPRELPDDGPVRVWMDTGSGAGAMVMVAARDLRVADLDDGQGASATYALRVRECGA